MPVYMQQYVYRAGQKRKKEKRTKVEEEADIIKISNM